MPRGERRAGAVLQTQLGCRTDALRRAGGHRLGPGHHRRGAVIMASPGDKLDHQDRWHLGHLFVADSSDHGAGQHLWTRLLETGGSRARRPEAALVLWTEIGRASWRER